MTGELDGARPARRRRPPHGRCGWPTRWTPIGALMRTTLLPGLLDTVLRNLSRGTRDLLVFEIGSVFLPRSNAPQPPDPRGRPQAGRGDAGRAERRAAEPAAAPGGGAGRVGRTSGLVGRAAARPAGRTRSNSPAGSARSPGANVRVVAGRAGAVAPRPLREHPGGRLADRLRRRTGPGGGRTARPAAADGGHRAQPGRVCRSGDRRSRR